MKHLYVHEISEDRTFVANVRRYVECPCLTIGRLALLLPIAELLFEEWIYK